MSPKPGLESGSTGEESNLTTRTKLIVPAVRNTEIDKLTERFWYLKLSDCRILSLYLWGHLAVSFSFFLFSLACCLSGVSVARCFIQLLGYRNSSLTENKDCYFPTLMTNLLPLGKALTVSGSRVWFPWAQHFLWSHSDLDFMCIHSESGREYRHSSVKCWILNVQVEFGTSSVFIDSVWDGWKWKF